MRFRDLFAPSQDSGGGDNPPSGSSQVGFTGGYDLEEVFYERTVVLLDCSGSMSIEMFGKGSLTRLDAAKSAARAFVDRKVAAFNQGPERFRGEIAVVAFGDEVEGHVPLTGYEDCPDLVLPFVARIETRGTTDFGKPLTLAGQLLSPGRETDPEILPRVILLTDGQHNGEDDPVAIAWDLKEQGVIIDTIGIGNTDEEPSADVDRNLLGNIASTLDGSLRYRFIRRSEELIMHFFSLAGTLSGGSDQEM